MGCGAVPGAWLRWQSGVHLGPVLGGTAVSDLLVNLIGSLILGFLAGPMPRRPSVLLLLGLACAAAGFQLSRRVFNA